MFSLKESFDYVFDSVVVEDKIENLDTVSEKDMELLFSDDKTEESEQSIICDEQDSEPFTSAIIEPITDEEIVELSSVEKPITTEIDATLKKPYFLCC